MNGRRHEAVIREAIGQACGVQVVGAIPRLDDPGALPGRHLGLVPPAERSDIARIEALVRRVASERLDIDAVLRSCGAGAPTCGAGAVPSGAGAVPCGAGVPPADHNQAAGRTVSIGYIRDSAFSFYYPENLEALEERGARLVQLSSLERARLPRDLDALYIGGGFRKRTPRPSRPTGRCSSRSATPRRPACRSTQSAAG